MKMEHALRFLGVAALFTFYVNLSIGLSACTTTTVKAGDRAVDPVGNPADRIVAAEIMRRYQPIETEALSKYINQVGQYVSFHVSPADKLIKCIDPNPKFVPTHGYRIGIVKSTQPLAVSTPGGFIFLSTSMIANLRSEDQLAGVIAHEVVHVMCGDHSPEDASVLGSGLGSYVDDLVGRAFTPEQLAEGDRGALVAMYRSGYYPSHYVLFVKSSENNPASQHPGGIGRASFMQADLAKMAGKVAKTVDARRIRFEAFQHGVAAAAN